MSTPNPSSAPQEPLAAAASVRRGSFCLIVHDDLELRLKLAALVREASGNVPTDTMTRANFDALPADRIRDYASIMFIVELVARDSGQDPLAPVARVHGESPLLPVFVFARGGDERSAARAIKLGATDYWPIHAVDVGELREALQPIVQRTRNALATKLPLAKPPTPELHSLPKIAGYRLLKKIAHSSSATVYLARNDDFPQPVALKIQAVKGPQGVSAADRQRFARECQILSSLNHRFVADVIDFGITDDYLFLALEYFPCGSMRERLRNPVRESDALGYVRQIAEGLRVVHAAGVVHRDLKPSNMMLTDDNRVVLIDFGSACANVLSDEVTGSDLRTGTPYYMCPEQIAGQDPDERGDLYSLGVVMFEMLAGTLPFRGTSLAQVLDGHHSGQIPRLPVHVRRYQIVIDRLLAKNPADRYASAAHFLEGLNALTAKPAAAVPRTTTTTTGAMDS
jgi:tRNA A-37 threonylcarbamoyl transferase component Bud32